MATVMPRNAQEFVEFVAKHFRPLEAMCRQRARFLSDDQIVAFLRPFAEEDKNLTRLIGRMREVGVLVELAGEWAPPPFLAEFIEKVSERHALASPKVIRSWVEALQKHVEELLSQINAASVDFDAFDADAGRFRLREISDIFQLIVRTVQENCERIAAEVGEYRMIEDASRLRRRLERLIYLHDEYLEPIIRIIDITGDFYAATEEVSNCCARLAVFVHRDGTSFGEEVRALQRDVVWLRRVVVRRAEEARRELAPLCEAAARESKIAKGVNRALEAVRVNNWEWLKLECHLIIVDEKDGTLFSDRGVESYLRGALEVASHPPPRVDTIKPRTLPIPLTPDDLIERLDMIESLDDLLGWVLEACDDVDLGAAVRLFHAIIEYRPDRARPTEERRDYERRDLVVNAAHWTWKRKDDANRNTAPHDRKPTRKARRSVPVT
jgi:hypothetical protein